MAIKTISWVKISQPKLGLEVLLCKYRKVRGDDALDISKQTLLGKVGRIAKPAPEQKDKSGCILVCVRVKEALTIWRLASLK